MTSFLQLDKFGVSNPLTALVPDLRGIDPDDAFSSVPYEKGFALLYYLQHLAGGSGMCFSFHCLCLGYTYFFLSFILMVGLKCIEFLFWSFCMYLYWISFELSDIFDGFLKSYIDHFKYQTITTKDFQDYLFSYFESKVQYFYYFAKYQFLSFWILSIVFYYKQQFMLSSGSNRGKFMKLQLFDS